MASTPDKGKQVYKYENNNLKEGNSIMRFSVGDLVRYKPGFREHVGVVKGWKDLGSPAESDSFIVLDVFWLSDPSMKLKPMPAEVELLK